MDRAKRRNISKTAFYEDGYLLPEPEDYDVLIVMAGPMGVYDTAKYLWLMEEKRTYFIVL